MKTKDEIIAGADSRTVPTDTLIPDDTDCKIHSLDGSFFAIAGFKRERTTNFDAERLAFSALRSNGSIIGRVNLFDQRIRKKMSDTIAKVHKLEPKYYQKHIEGALVLQAAFFGFKDKVPYLYVRDTDIKTMTGKIYWYLKTPLIV